MHLWSLTVWHYRNLIIMPPSLIGGDIKQFFCLTSLCLSVAYIGNNSRTERPTKTKIGTEIALVTRDSDTTFKVKRSRSLGRFTHCGFNAWSRCSGDGENVLGVGKTTATLRLGAHGGRRRAGHIVSSRAQFVNVLLLAIIIPERWSCCLVLHRHGNRIWKKLLMDTSLPLSYNSSSKHNSKIRILFNISFSSPQGSLNICLHPHRNLCSTSTSNKHCLLRHTSPTYS